MAKDQYQPSTTVLCFEKFKEAALYFDRVLPLNMGRMRGDSDVGDILVGYPEEVPSAALSHLIDGIEGNTVTYSHATRIIEFTADKWVEFARKVEPYAKLWTDHPQERNEDALLNEYRRLEKAYFENASIDGLASIRDAFKDYAKSLGFNAYCVAIPSACEFRFKLDTHSTANWTAIPEQTGH